MNSFGPDSADEGKAGPERSAGPEPRATLASAVFCWDEREEITTPIGSRKAFFDRPTGALENLEIHATTIRGGEASHPAHRHPEEELVIVKAGTLEIMINGALHPAGPGSVIFYASGDLHGMRNCGATPATYHVIRWTATATAIPAHPG